MEETLFNTQSWEICDQALNNLRTKKLAPLPIYYENEFHTLLEQQACDELSCKVYENEGSQNNVNKYLEIAQLALEAFASSHKEINQVMETHASRMAPSHGYSEKYLSENCTKIVDNLSKLDNEMSEALLKAHDQIAELTEKIELLHKENSIDSLTKFFSRKELFKDLASIAHNLENKEFEQGCCLIMIDLDDFKTVNDNFSHLAGDKTLVFIAKTIHSIIRGGDKAYRFGGDEFIIVLNRTSLEDAQKIAEKIRSSIEKAHLYYENHKINITVSIGVTQLREKDFEASLLKADKALYEAKNNRKNQVYMID